MITIIRIILFFHEYLNELPADPSWLHHLPGCKNKSRGSPAPNAHILKNRVYTKTYPSLVMGPAVPRERECV